MRRRLRRTASHVLRGCPPESVYDRILYENRYRYHYLVIITRREAKPHRNSWSPPPRSSFAAIQGECDVRVDPAKTRRPSGRVSRVRRPHACRRPNKTAQPTWAVVAVKRAYFRKYPSAPSYYYNHTLAMLFLEREFHSSRLNRKCSKTFFFPLRNYLHLYTVCDGRLWLKRSSHN